MCSLCLESELNFDSQMGKKKKILAHDLEMLIDFQINTFYAITLARIDLSEYEKCKSPSD
jgi:hypothetical protein